MGVNRLPFYSFICHNCGHKWEQFREMAHSDDPALCPCGELMGRDFQADLPTQSSCGREYRKPIISNSLAISIDQVAEHRRLFPDIPLTKEGQPVFTNYASHDKYLEKTGFVKKPKKIKHRVKKVQP